MGGRSSEETTGNPPCPVLHSTAGLALGNSRASAVIIYYDSQQGQASKAAAAKMPAFYWKLPAWGPHLPVPPWQGRRCLANTTNPAQ